MKTKLISKDAAGAMISLAGAIAEHQKKSTAKQNAHQFFQDLIVSLTKHKKKWTATERMQYNRVARFLTL